MGYTLCVLGVRVRTSHASIADPDRSPPCRMRNDGRGDNVRRARQPPRAEPPPRPKLRPAQVGVPHARNLHAHRRRRRPHAARPLRRLRAARRKRAAPAREISCRPRRRDRPGHRRGKRLGRAAVRCCLAVVRTASSSVLAGARIYWTQH